MPRRRVIRTPDGSLIAVAGFRVYRSTDGGITWRQVGAVLLGRASRTS